MIADYSDWHMLANSARTEMAAKHENDSHPLRIIVIDNMRNRSHLFWRWFSTLPGLQPHLHPYTLPAMFGPDGWQKKLRTNEAREESILALEKTIPHTTLQESLETVREWVARADEARETLFFNEHAMFLMEREELLDLVRKEDAAYTAPQQNPSHVPEALLATFTPVFVIRHPALSVPSLWKQISPNTPIATEDEDFDVYSSSQFSRTLFDYFKMISGQTPLVVDGEDVVWRTEELGRNLCKALGLDPAGLRSTWQPTTEDVRPKEGFRWSLTKAMHESTGIVRPATKPDEPDIETAYPKWKQQFGDRIATGLHKRAEQNMLPYDYLKQFAV